MAPLCSGSSSSEKTTKIGEGGARMNIREKKKRGGEGKKGRRER